MTCADAPGMNNCTTNLPCNCPTPTMGGIGVVDYDNVTDRTTYGFTIPFLSNYLAGCLVFSEWSQPEPSAHEPIIFNYNHADVHLTHDYYPKNGTDTYYSPCLTVTNDCGSYKSQCWQNQVFAPAYPKPSPAVSRIDSTELIIGHPGTITVSILNSGAGDVAAGRWNVKTYDDNGWFVMKPIPAIASGRTGTVTMPYTPGALGWVNMCADLILL